MKKYDPTVESCGPGEYYGSAEEDPNGDYYYVTEVDLRITTLESALAHEKRVTEELDESKVQLLKLVEQGGVDRRRLEAERDKRHKSITEAISCIGDWEHGEDCAWKYDAPEVMEADGVECDCGLNKLKEFLKASTHEALKAGEE